MGDKPEKKEILNIDQRVNRIMGEVDYIKKDKHISFGKGGGYPVVGHDAVTKLIHPLLVKYGVNIIPTTKKITQEGNRTRVDLEFRWVNIDNPTDHFVTEASGYGIDQQDKGIGKGWSVAQRYTVLKTLHLETGDKDIEDDDIDHKAIDDFANEVEQKLNTDQQNELVEVAVALDIPFTDVTQLITEHGYKKAKEIPVSKLDFFKDKLKQLAEQGVENVS